MKKDRHTRVEVVCATCGNAFEARKERVDKGLGRFCSKKCFDIEQVNRRKPLYGRKDLATKYKTGNRYSARWYDEEGKTKSTSYPKWWWEVNVGEIPKGMIVMYKDGNPMNTDPSNFELGTRSAALVRGNQTRKKDIASYSEYRNKQSQMMQAKWKSGIFKHLLGASHYRWRGGHPNSWKEYPKDFFEIREFVISRDNNKCQICSKIIAKKPHVHHRDGNKENNDQNNLLTLCASCHGKVHSKNRESPPIMALRSELHWSK